LPVEVSTRFNALLGNLMLTSAQQDDGKTKHTGVRTCLNTYYYNSSSGYNNSMLVGSWGKSTEIRPPRDIDILFTLPDSVFLRYHEVQGNKQSQLLQEVRRVLSATYSTTKMRADGQVVVVPFTSYSVEVVPAFTWLNGQYAICDTNNGGKYKITDPNAEIESVKYSNDVTKGNTRNLIRMMKCWQAYCNVPLKSFCIEMLVIDFLRSYEYKDKTTVYYDWMVRDFFKYLIAKANGCVAVSGTLEIIWLGDDWKSRAESAYKHALDAISWESANYSYSAGQEWQKIFGTDIPTG
jgi:hypothetical protein